MATSPSEPAAAGSGGFEIIAGGPASAEEVAALAAALDALVDEAEDETVVSRWRWSGRRWPDPRWSDPRWSDPRWSPRRGWRGPR